MDGKKTKEMVKGLFGLRIKKRNLKENILVIGSMIKNSEEELCFLIMMIDMMDFGKMIYLMEMEE